jgi:hypothetical protein
MAIRSGFGNEADCESRERNGPMTTKCSACTEPDA